GDVLLNEGADLGGYWRFDEASGELVAVDSSGNNRDASVNGGVAFGDAGADPQTSNTAATFDGSAGYLSTGTTAGDLGFGGDYTASAWIKLDSGGLSGDSTIFGTAAGGNSQNNNSLHLVVRNGKLHFGNFGTAFDTPAPGSAPTLVADQWYHVTYRYDTATQTQTTFLDGVLYSQGTGKVPFGSVDGEGLTKEVEIGRWQNTASRLFEGVIDEASVISRSLTDDEIAALAATGPGYSGAASTTLQITNVAPTVALQAVDPIDENGEAILRGTVTDPGTLDSFRITVDWDDVNDTEIDVFNLEAMFSIDPSTGMTTAQLEDGDTFTAENDASLILTVSNVDTDAGTFDFEVRHTYLDDGPASPTYTANGNGTASDTPVIKVTVADDDTVPYEAIVGGDASLTGHWRFEENAGATTAVNSGSASNADGTVNGDTDFGATSADPNLGGAATFDGDADTIGTGLTAAELGFTGSFTASAWINLSDLTGDNTIFGTETRGTNNGLHLVIRNGLPHFGFFSNDITGSPALNTNQWYNVSFRYDLVTQTQSIFVDGVQVAEREGAPAFASTGSGIGANAEVFLGDWDDTREMYFSGLMDEVSVTARAMSDTEIAALAASAPVMPGMATTTVTVNNVEPTLVLTPITPINENEAAVVEGTLTDIGQLDSHQITIDWDDPNDTAIATFSIPAINTVNDADGTTTQTIPIGQPINSSTDDSVLVVTSVQANGVINFRVTHLYEDDGLDPGINGSSTFVAEDGTDQNTSTVSVTVVDDDAGTATETEDVEINNVAPVPATNAASTNEEAAIVIDLLAGANDQGPRDDIFLDSINTVGTAGQVTINPDNRTVTYDPLDVFQNLSAGEMVTDTFTYTLIDDDGSVTTQLVTVTIIGQNDDPILRPDIVRVNEGGVGGPDTAVGNALANDRDPDQNGSDIEDVLEVVNIRFQGDRFDGSANTGGKVTQRGTAVDGAFGTLQIDRNGNFVYAVNNELPAVRELREGETRTETFRYRVSDGNGGIVTEVIQVIVRGSEGGVVNDQVLTGGSSVLEGFRFATPGGLQGGDESGANRPILTLIPTYSGTSAPFSVLTISILGPNGEFLSGGTKTIVADAAGNWKVEFSGLVLPNSNHYIQVETRPPVWDTGAPGFFRTFFSPNIHGSYLEFDNLSVDSIFGRRLPTVAIEELNNLNRNPNGSNEDWRTANGLNGWSQRNNVITGGSDGGDGTSSGGGGGDAPLNARSLFLQAVEAKEQGNITYAIYLLELVLESDPDFENAAELLEQWKAEEAN
ncbi:MAG: LamG-like jellyroll fold domain-containing protein, partial [Verrucomicrobiota bacterium]